MNSQDVRLMLWDTAGQEEFDAITKAYYRGAQACVVAFSTTDRASFDAVVRWKSKVRRRQSMKYNVGRPLIRFVFFCFLLEFLATNWAAQ